MKRALLFGLVLVLLVAGMAQAQKNENITWGSPVTASEFEHAKSALGMGIANAINIPENDLPMMRDSAIIVEGGQNGDTRRRVQFVTKNPRGTYLLQGITNTNDVVWLGGFFYGSSSDNQVKVGSALVMNGTVGEVFPGMDIWQVNAFHINGGSVEILSAITGQYQDPAQEYSGVAVEKDSIENGKYVLSLGSLVGPDATVVIGRYGVADWKASSAGGGRAFLDPEFLGYGSSTVTICDRLSKRCGTVNYTRKAQPQPQPPSVGGKGLTQQ